MHPKEFKTKMRYEPKLVGGVRNSFGTRLCQRIECSRCHKVDYVAKRLASAKTVYCRDCAERLLGAFEAGRTLDEKKISCVCSKCKIEFWVLEEIALKKEELQCQDCYRGFEVWRGKISGKINKEPYSLVAKSGSNTIIRKVLDDKI